MTPQQWGERIRGHRAALERHAYRLSKDRERAGDLVQDTLERAWRCSAAFGAEPPPRAWLMRVITNLFIDHCRRRRLETDDAVPVEDLASEPALPRPAAPSADDAIGALARIPRELREIVEAHDLRGLRYREIAAELAIPIGTVGTRLARARRELRRVLERGAPGAA